MSEATKRDFNRREAPRFNANLDVRLQPHDQPAASWTCGRLRDISVRGFYFFSPVRHEIGSRFMFSIPWQIGQKTKEPGQLMNGIAYIVRCEELGASGEAEAYGIAAKIDEAIPIQ